MITENKEFITIDFTGLFKMLIRKFRIILLFGVLGAGITGGYARFVLNSVPDVPMYRSRIKLYITGNETLTPSANAKLLGQSFFGDYCELMKSEKVLSHVVGDLGLNMTNAQLWDCVSTKWISGTCMAYISVTFPDAPLAKAIVDDLVRVTSAYALEIIGMTPPKIYEEAVVASDALRTSDADVRKYAVLGFAVGVGLVSVLLTVLFFTDKKLRTPEQIAEKGWSPVYAVFLCGRQKKIANYDHYAMQRLYEKIYMQHNAAKTIGFFSMAKEKKEPVMEQYAKYLQAIGKKVLLLDTRLCNPVGDNGDGLLAYLQGKADDIAAIIHKKNGTDCIDCSKGVPNAIEYLDSVSFERLLAKVSSRYDYILLNTESLEKSAEAWIVRKKIEVSLLVVEAGRTSYPAYESFMETDHGISGVIFSKGKAKVRSRRFKKEYGRFFGIS